MVASDSGHEYVRRNGKTCVHSGCGRIASGNGIFAFDGPGDTAFASGK